MPHYKIETYVMPRDEHTLMAALNDADVLREGPYDYVYVSSEVTGHWRPLEGADPHSGDIGALSTERELKIEFRIRAEDLELTLSTIRANHPYEVPVINVIDLVEQ